MWKSFFSDKISLNTSDKVAILFFLTKSSLRLQQCWKCMSNVQSMKFKWKKVGLSDPNQKDIFQFWSEGKFRDNCLKDCEGKNLFGKIMGNLDIFEGGDVVHTERENFHLNIFWSRFSSRKWKWKEIPGLKDSLQGSECNKKTTWSRRRNTEMSVRSAPLKIDNC